ncbi:SDR family oxidoreductase [Candidatus Pelagibacter ubique]|jgi:nucleoside-diphosphate-sugar epimerase|nr:SDR family oxidoreductase [Candidatus Pelagibacter ubique]
MSIKDKKILVTGGCGYVGSVLVHKLLKKNAHVVVYDTQWFGNYLEKNNKLEFIRDDIRNIDKYNLEKFDKIVHLANIANDPGVELNPSLSWEVNVLASHQIMDKINNSSVDQIVYASSGSVYGVKEEENVTEELSLVPISIYNKTKMVSEKVLMSFKDKFKVHCIRPATVCGISPRMRLDVSVNMLTFQALKNKVMTIHGGQQVRPNIHISDLTNAIIHFLENQNIESGVYNAGFENLSILDIAKRVNEKVKSEIKILPVNDIRSYRLNSDKLLNTGFKKEKSVNNAIDEIVKNFNDGKLVEKDSYYTVKWMKHLKI